ncbi:mRNA interferase MazF [Bradyrhizobium sp. AZCC 1719]|uniref:type II toxin-antitoxin system PemK/MazF family toxin n=1 Tax=Bradyrhizobium sp. AZCC 1719 TaxID=3117028 RepID=UPI002FF294D3
MQMRRGDLVIVAAAGDYGTPRPAVIVQTDAFPESHASVVICQLTSDLADAPDFRVTIEPNPENGLRLKSLVMADKPVTVRRERIGQRIGHLGNQDMARSCFGVCLGARGLTMLLVQAPDSKIDVRLSAA